MSSVLDAVYRTVRAYPGGAESLAPRLGTTANVLRNKVSLTQSTHHVRLDEAVDLMAITGDIQVLHAIASELGYVVIPVFAPDELENEDLLVRFNRMYQAMGKFAADTNMSIADGLLEEKEVRALHRDILDMNSQLHSLLAQLVAVYGAGK